MNESQVFTDALKLATPAQRAAYLDRACAGDPALRAAVDCLLRAHDRDPDFLERPIETLSGTLAATTAGARLPPEPIGLVIAGRYKLFEEIGEGGMGTVWMAQQHEPVKRLVAIKLIKPGMDSRQVLARFEAERQALALMDHPNIAKVFDAGAVPDGRPFFAMELVKGVPITKYCDDHRLPPRERLELFVPVCHAIQHAHQKGIIHRDLKPSNVLVALYDDKPVPKVIDFGVAKATGQQLTDETLHTGFGAVVGTVEYMSPEQATFNQLDIDTRSDVYSLGVLLYELLTGTTPLDRARLKETPLLELMRIVREDDTVPPSTRLGTAESLPAIAANRGLEPRKLSGLVRGELDWIVMTALEKDRSRRYATANSLATDLQRYLTDEPVLACPPSAGYRMRKFAWRNRGRLAVAAGMFLAITVMAASIGWAVGDRVARRAAAEAQVRASLHTARAWIAENKLVSAREKLAEARAHLVGTGSALDDLAAEVAAVEAELDRYQQFLDLIDRGYQAEITPALEPLLPADDSSGNAERRVRSTRTVGRRPAAAVPFLLEALRRYGVLEVDDWTRSLEGRILGKSQVEQIRRLAYETLIWLADDIVRRKRGHPSGEILSEEAAARQALIYLDRAEGVQTPTHALQTLRARCRKVLGDNLWAQKHIHLMNVNPATTALDHYLWGQAACDSGQLAEAVEAFEAALRLDPTHYWSLMRLGQCLTDLGRSPEDFAAAVRVFTGCILKRPDHAHAYSCRGVAYARLQRYPEAEADHARAIELDPRHAFAWTGPAAVYNDLGRLAQALQDSSRAIELDPEYADGWNTRGIAYHRLAQPAKALADLLKAVELNPKHAHAWHNCGIVHNRLGQSGEAVADFTKAIELDPTFASAWYGRGNSHARLAQHANAVADFTKAVELDPLFWKAWYNRGNSHHKLRRQNEALADFSKAIELEPTFAAAWYNRGLTYNRLDQPDKAVADLSKAIELIPNKADTWCDRGVAHNKLRQPAKALADYSKAIELDPTFVRAWYNRGNVHYGLGQLDKAVADYSKAIELDSKHALAWHGRGAVYNQLGQPDKAVAEFSRAIELEPKDRSNWNSRGVAYVKLGELDRAIADYSKAIELDPKYASAWNNRGSARSKQGKRDEGIADYSKAIELDPKLAMAWHNRGLEYFRLGQPDKAIADYSKAIELDPKFAGHWQGVGLAHYRAGNWKAAVAALDKSLELHPAGDAYDWLFLAMAHWKLGHADEARRAYERAVQWLEKNSENLAKNQRTADDLRRFRAEAEVLLELKKK